MPDSPNLVFVWTDQQAVNTLGAYGNDQIETPNLDGLANESVLFERAYVSEPSCGPSRSTVMTGLYPHASGVVENNASLPGNIACLPELASFNDYSTVYMGKWHLGDEVFAQHGFDEWVSIEDQYRQYYSEQRDENVHSTYHRFLVENGFEPDRTEADGFEWFSRSFCAKLPEKYTKAAYLATEATRFIEENRDRPFLLYVMFLEPHPPYKGPRNDQYDPAEVTLPPNFQHDELDDQPLRIRLMRETIRRGLADRQPEFWDGPPDESDWRRLIANYWGLVSLVDAQVGAILDTLDDCGLIDDTVTVYTSDHGDTMGSHGLLSKFVMFEEASRVPLLLRVPGADRNGTRVETPISQVDLVPTLLDALDRPLPDHLQGTSWLPTLRGGDVPERNVFVVRNGPKTVGMAGRIGDTAPGERSGPMGVRPRIRPELEERWLELADEGEILDAMTEPVRTIVTPEGLKLNYRPGGRNELYDVANDPHEMDDLSTDPEYDDTVEELSDRILKWQNRVRDPLYLY